MILSMLFFESRSESRMWCTHVTAKLWQAGKLILTSPYDTFAVVTFPRTKPFSNTKFSFLPVRLRSHNKEIVYYAVHCWRFLALRVWFHELNNCRLLLHVTFRHRHVCYYYCLNFFLSSGHENSEFLRAWESGKVDYECHLLVQSDRNFSVCWNFFVFAFHSVQNWQVNRKNMADS
jgi:hypothetical protein